MNNNTKNAESDNLAIEEPLEISLEFVRNGARIKKNISVTMRTPGQDAQLAIGFLFTEGIIINQNQIEKITSDNLVQNKITITLTAETSINLEKLERHFYTTSSCGVCGKSSIEAVKTISNLNPEFGTLKVDLQLIYQLPARLRAKQSIFESTGGLHAASLFDNTGNLVMLHEDVGRHNALDKLVGEALIKNMLPLSDYILLLSGRASFELIQKAYMSGIKVVAAVGAPSSLAVELSKEFDITLIGFLREQRFNIYCGEERIQ